MLETETLSFLSVRGKDVYINSKRPVGKVEGIIVDLPGNRVLGLSVRSRKLPRNAYIELSQIKKIGDKAVHLTGDCPVMPSSTYGMKNLTSLSLYNIISKDGVLIGELSDIKIDNDGIRSLVFLSGNDGFEVDKSKILAVGESLIIIDEQAPDFDIAIPSQENTTAERPKSERIRSNTKQIIKTGSKKITKKAEKKEEDKKARDFTKRQLKHLTGHKVSADITDDSGVIILSSGEEINEEMIEKIIDSGKAAELMAKSKKASPVK